MTEGFDTVITQGPMLVCQVCGALVASYTTGLHRSWHAAAEGLGSVTVPRAATHGLTEEESTERITERYGDALRALGEERRSE